MTDDQINAVLAPLIIAFPFTDDQSNLWAEKLRALTDYEAAVRARDNVIDEVESLRAPQWSVYKKIYDRWYARLEEQREEKTRELESGGRLAGTISPKEGRQIAAAAYAKQYKRRPPADIFSLPDPEFVPSAQHEEIEKALNVIRGGYDHEGWTFSRYTDVLKAFDGHQLTARAAVKALVDSGMVIHHPNGTLLLRRAA